jgi:hypothetical protein
MTGFLQRNLVILPIPELAEGTEVEGSEKCEPGARSFIAFRMTRPG